MFESLKAKVEAVMHEILAEIEAAEVKAQQVTSVAVDQTGPGADVLNAGEAQQEAGQAAADAGQPAPDAPAPDAPPNPPAGA